MINSSDDEFISPELTNETLQLYIGHRILEIITLALRLTIKVYLSYKKR